MIFRYEGVLGRVCVVNGLNVEVVHVSSVVVVCASLAISGADDGDNDDDLMMMLETVASRGDNLTR